MAFDGIVIANMVSELKARLLGGRITKISQPEKDELILTIKGGSPAALSETQESSDKSRYQQKLFISAGAGLPLIYLTENTKMAPLTAPNFCMLLRKYLNSARILDISQPGLERIISFKIEHLDELGDVCEKYLIVEIMGKHSNIIFCDSEMKIIDSIKHVSSFVSSLREVLPGRSYFIVQTSEKINPLELTREQFMQEVVSQPLPIGKALYTKLTGLSPLAANEICFRSGIDSDASTSSLSDDEALHLYNILSYVTDDIRKGTFHPNIVYCNGTPHEFSSIKLTCFEDMECETFDSISLLLEKYYSQKNALTRIHQKSADLRKIVSNALERTAKKYSLQQKQLDDTQKRDKYRIYGELLTTYGYSAEPGSKSMTCQNYYTGEDITIPLDPQLTALENARHYFDKYSKLKRTFEATSKHIEETRDELSHLDSIKTSLDMAVLEEDLAQLKDEMTEYGYMKRPSRSGKGSRKNAKKARITSTPYHFVSSDGYDMYVGKNNYQNEELTFKFAGNSDWWFHAKGIPGSHVIVKSNGQELPDTTFEEAACLAAYFSKGRESDKVEIDYLERRNVKKPGGSKPGFVVYYTNYSMMASPDISRIKEI